MGGASQIPFIKMYFEQETDNIPIRSDLDPYTSAVYGGLYFIMKKYKKNQLIQNLDDFINYSVYMSFFRNVMSTPPLHFNEQKGFLFLLCLK